MAGLNAVFVPAGLTAPGRLRYVGGGRACRARRRGSHGEG